MKLSTLSCQAVLAALLLPANVLTFSNIVSTKNHQRSSSLLQMSSSANQEYEGLPVIRNMDRRSAIMGTIGTVIFANNSNMNIASATVTNANNIPNWTLDNNVQFPLLALNTVALTAEETERAFILTLLDEFGIELDDDQEIMVYIGIAVLVFILSMSSVIALV